MSSKKRVFATNNIVNYNDLYKIKNGCEVLKTIKNENNHAILKQFKNYKQMQELNKAYFMFIDNDAIEVNNIRDLYNSNNSYSHNECNDDCSSCKKNKNDCNKCNMKYNNECNECNIKCNNECNNELYLKGKILVKKTIPQQIPSNILICKWCNNNNKIHPDDVLHHSLKKNKIQNFCNCKCFKTKDNLKYSNCSLCKNAKQLFI